MVGCNSGAKVRLPGRGILRRAAKKRKLLPGSAGRGDEVHAVAAEGVAAGNAPEGEPEAADGAVGGEGFGGVATAGGVETAAAAEEVAEGVLVEVDEGEGAGGEGAGDEAAGRG